MASTCITTNRSLTMNAFIHRVGATLGLFVLASIAFAACGGSKESHEVEERPVEEPILAVASKSAYQGGFTCQAARVRLGRRASTIRFTVACVDPIEGKVYFSLGRTSLTDTPTRPGYRRIGNHPRVSGPGAVRRHGACSRVGSGIACQARARGPVIVHGNFDVRPSTRCELGVSVRVVDRSGCGSEACATVEVARILTGGKPRGC